MVLGCLIYGKEEIMPYRIKAYLIMDGKIECRFEAVMKDFNDVVEFLSRVSLTAYDVVKVLPEDFKEN